MQEGTDEMCQEMRSFTPEEPAPSRWTAALVFARICEAISVASVCIRHPGPSSKMVATLEIEPSKGQDEPELGTKRKAATPAEVSRMEETLQWMERHVIDARARAMLAQLARARAIGGNFRRICRARGWGKTNAYETCNVNLQAIAGALNRAGVRVNV